MGILEQAAMMNSVNNANAPFLGQQNAAQNAYVVTNSTMGQSTLANQYARELNRDANMVGVFKILRAEDGFIVHCAQGEGYMYKTYVANDIDEAFDKAKAHLVVEAMSK